MSMSQRRAVSRPVKVLIVEQDDAAAGHLAQVLVTHAGADEFIVSRISRPNLALNNLATQHPDLILVSLPNSTDAHEQGQRLCQDVRANEGQRHTGIIMIAAPRDDISSLSVDCLEMGADDFVLASCTSQELMARVKAVLRLKAMTDELRTANHKLQILSMTDELTGLANMRCFTQRYGDLIRECRKSSSSVGLGIVMLDLDHFKSVNDSTNHLIGSFVLCEIGRLLRQKGILDEADVPARYGGDEFIIASPCDSIEILNRKAEGIRRLIAATEFKRDGCTIRITSSIGVTWTAPQFEGRAEDLIKAADLMLYRSKNQGRDRVSSMVLKYPIDLDHVSRKHLVEMDVNKDGETVSNLRKL